LRVSSPTNSNSSFTAHQKSFSSESQYDEEDLRSPSTVYSLGVFLANFYYRPFEAARLDAELKLAGEYGLRNKREIWYIFHSCIFVNIRRVQLTLSKIRRAARELLTLEERDPRRLFEGNALIRRLVRIGVLDESRMKLDYVLALKVEDFLERRLQTQVFKLGLAKSIHHARVLIRQRHIRVGSQVLFICVLPF